MIAEILNNLGLNEKEVVVYLAVLKEGKITALHIANKTKLKRTTVYAILDRLVGKRLIIKRVDKKIDSYIPSPTENLREMFAKEESELFRKKELAKRASLELAQYGSNASFSIPKTTFVPEEDMENYLYDNTPKWNESMMKYDSTLWGFTTPTYVQEFSDYIEWWSRKSERSIALKLFSSNTQVEQDWSKKYPHRQMKFWPGKKFNTSLTVQGDYVVIENSAKPFYLIDIYDKVLADNMREMFKVMWGLL